MLTKIEIENFKSIYKETIELGRVNVFIGENGCGKTNILEAVGMASAAFEKKLSFDELATKGIRVANPKITFSSFKQEKQKYVFDVRCHFTNSKVDAMMPLSLTVIDIGDIYSEWINIYDIAEGSLNLPHKSHEFNKFSLLGYKIFHLSTLALRGIELNSREIPGVNGENLDRLIKIFSKEEMKELMERAHFITWLDEIFLDSEDKLKFEGHKMDLSTSILYFRDKFMAKKNNIFSAENANEGILHILFYLALFISKRTPKFFAIDNIETALNPYLCTVLMEELVKLAKENDKQVLITTHNPAILDGLNLYDDEVRLFVVERDFKGHTRVERKKLKPDVELNGRRLKMSELWMRGYLGAIPQHF